MDIQLWMLIMSVVFCVMAIGFVVAIVFLIRASLEIKNSALMFKGFLKNAEEKLFPVFQETEQTLKSLRKVSGDVEVVTEKARGFSEEINNTIQSLKALNGVVHDLEKGVTSVVSDSKVDVKTVLNALLKEFVSK